MKSVTFSTDYPVLSRLADANARLSVRAIVQMLFDAADLHAAQWSVSLGQLSQGQETWVLSRLHLRLDRHPDWNERITVTTWPTGAKRILAGRDFEIRTGDERIGRATTFWLMIDRETRKPVSLPEFVQSFSPPSGSPVVDTGSKWVPPDRSEEPYRAVVKWCDLDLNNHTGARCYLEWLLRSIHHQHLEKSELAELDILFKSESFMGEEVAVYVSEIEGTSSRDHGEVEFTHRIECQTDERLLATARSLFRSAAE